MKLFALISLSLLTTAAFAGNGDVTCGSNWKICLQSYSTDMNATIHYVGTVKQDNTEVRPSDNLIIENQSGSVIAKGKDGGADIILGKISEAIDEAGNHAALSRELVLSEGLTSKVTSQEGKKVTLCNQTALGLIYERYTYRTTDNTFTVSKDGKAVFSAQSNERIEPAVSVHSSIFPCAK